MELVGICGIYCGTCPKYLAPRDNDLEEMQKTAQTSGVSLEEVPCDGCLSDRLYRDCVECKHGFRRCAQEKNVTCAFNALTFPASA